MSDSIITFIFYIICVGHILLTAHVFKMIQHRLDNIERALRVLEQAVRGRK
jgi:hypothetical protein